MITILDFEYYYFVERAKSGGLAEVKHSDFQELFGIEAKLKPLNRSQLTAMRKLYRNPKHRDMVYNEQLKILKANELI